MGHCRCPGNGACAAGGEVVRIRVVREAGGIGDVVRVIPVLRGLRQQYPSAELWVFAPDAYKPLLRGWQDEFRSTPWHGRRPRDMPLDESRWPYLDASVGFDRSISLYCPAFRHEQRQRGDIWLDRIDLFCAAAGVAPTERTPRVNPAPADVAAAQEYVERYRLRRAGKLIALQPFSTDPARNWPLQNWRRLADILEWLGHRVIVFDGCRGRTNAFRQHRATGRPLGFVAALLQTCDLLVAPDSGLGHLAAAVQTPTVGLFASQSGPVMYRHYPLHTYIYPPWDGQKHCRWPCFWQRPAACSRSALAKAGRTCAMLARISVEDVYDAVTARLDAPRPQLSEPVCVPPMTTEQIETLGPCETVDALPIPRRDFSCDRLALASGTDDLGPVLCEAYRVLRPGGALFLPAQGGEQDSRLLRSCGFERRRHRHEAGMLACRKTGTWPRTAAPLTAEVALATGFAVARHALVKSVLVCHKDGSYHT